MLLFTGGSFLALGLCLVIRTHSKTQRKTPRDPSAERESTLHLYSAHSSYLDPPQLQSLSSQVSKVTRLCSVSPSCTVP